jgi:hypothetical protein
MNYAYNGAPTVVDDVAPCGTYAGLQRHIRTGEEPCTPCKLARNSYMRDWRRRTGQTTSALVDVDIQCPNCGHHILEGQP